MKFHGKYPSTRLRRGRNEDWVRRLISENNLSINDLIMPIFICEGKNKIEKIHSMPGVYRYSLDKLGSVIKRIHKLKIPLVALFPYISPSKKDIFGSEALNENNLICRALKTIKKNFEIGVMCDVALDPFTNHGHDGLLKNNKVVNDETIKVLIQQALLYAKNNCDIIAPSDMMDGRIGLIRKSLEKNNFINTKLFKLWQAI